MSATLSTQCCVVGGGPAGLMAGFLLARAGVDVIVLEKHADFLRDFRGDTIHPSTLRIMDELGLLDEFLRLPHHKAYALSAWIGERQYKVADFSSLPGTCNFIAFMPQWDFLDFIAEHARALPNFRLLMQTAGERLLFDGDRVCGVSAKGPEGELKIEARLVIAADGRSSPMREDAKLPVEDFGAPMDVLWFKLPRKESDPDESFGRVAPGRMLAMIDRGSYWQCGCVIPKGDAEKLREKGIETFRDSIAGLTPFLADRVERAQGLDRREPADRSGQPPQDLEPPRIAVHRRRRARHVARRRRRREPGDPGRRRRRQSPFREAARQCAER